MAQRVVLLLCLGLWLLSLTLPAIGLTGGPTLSGWDVLLRGHSAWRQGVVAWFANPLLAAALAASWWRRDRAAIALAIVAVLVGVTSFWAEETARGSGTSVPSFSYLPGFYVWLAAQTGVLFAAAAGLAMHRNRAQS